MGERVVCVTGGSGFIASWVVKLLLDHGYTVRVTVRDTDDPNKTHHLLQLNGAKERLQLFRADILEKGSFDSIVSGCQGVFHTASPVILNPTNPKMELIDPAVNGTLHVLASCAKFPSIKRVVITSSIVTLLFNGKPLTSGVVVDESWFSDPIFCEESKLWYVLSKTLAEDAAYEYAKEKGIDLVTLHPGFVIGPLLQPRLNLSSELFLNLIHGADNLPAHHRFVDVRDVAEAHVQALESPSATGRYCLVAQVVTTAQVHHLLRQLYPSLLQIHQCEDDEGAAPYEISNERANKGLGVDFIPWEQSVKDTVKSLKDKNYLLTDFEEQQ